MDLAIIAIVAFCVWRGYKNGLIRGVFGVVALVVSIFVANIAATAYSEEFTGMLKPFVGGIVDTTLVDMIEEDDVFDPEMLDPERFDPEAYDIDIDRFGTAFTALRRIGLPEAAAARIAATATERGITGFLSDIVAERLSSSLAFVAVFAIAFILTAIIFAVIGNLVGFVFSLPGLRLVDIIAGTALGLAKGLLIVYTIATVVRYFGLVAVSTIEETRVLSYLINYNPIADILGL
jgi:uncharacterized membrane protein required for colicin V production